MSGPLMADQQAGNVSGPISRKMLPKRLGTFVMFVTKHNELNFDL